MDTPYDIVELASVGSTQDDAAARLRKSGSPTLVIAARQTDGRGRQGRSWEQPARALFSSFALESRWALVDRPLITLCTAVALRRAILDVCEVDTAIKWPNDLLMGEGKTAGILVEGSGDVVTIGSGVNLWWPERPAYAAAVYTDDPGGEVARDLGVAWVDELVPMLAAGPAAWPRSEYLAACATIGAEVSWDGGSGTAVDVGERGCLEVQTAAGVTTITAGEVHTRTRD